MAEKRNNIAPETVVIHAGPTFGSAIRFMILGAVLGAAATYLISRSGEASAHEEAQQTLRATENKAQKLQSRLGRLSSRAKGLAVRAKDAAVVFNEHVRPALQDAMQEGKLAARETSESLQDDIRQEFPAKKPFDDLTTEEA